MSRLIQFTLFTRFRSLAMGAVTRALRRSLPAMLPGMLPGMFPAAILLLVLLLVPAGGAQAQKKGGGGSGGGGGGGGGGSPTAPQKKLIELGWDIPNTAYLRQNIAQMEQTPFDGTVLFAYYNDPASGALHNFSREVFGRTPVPADALAPAIEDLRATRATRFTDNFLRVNVSPGDFDWFDDAAVGAVVQNLNLAARIAREGSAGAGVKGIFLDTEHYANQGRVFHYQSQAGAGMYSFAQYAARVRAQGRRMMEQAQAGYPDLTVLLTFGPSFTWLRMQQYGLPLEHENILYNLLPAFVNGLVDGAQGKAKIVDGFEMSYYHDTPEQFDASYDLIKKGCLPLIADRKRYASYVSAGFGLWLDRDWSKLGGWNLTDFTMNYHTPAAFNGLATKALVRSEGYAWVYSQQLNWWTGANVPAEYAAALADAKTRANAAP